MAASRLALLVVLGTGCVFDTGGLVFEDEDAALEPADAARVADAFALPDAFAPPDAAPPPDATPPFCPADPALVGCYRFDGDGDDGSPADQDAVATDVSWGVGVVGGAIVTNAQSLVRVAEHAGLDVQALTIELWARPYTLPTDAARAGLVDNDGQYGLFVYAGGEVRCTTAGQLVSYAPIEVLAWTHIACTYDPITGMALYVDGAPVASAPATGLPNTAGTGGLAIASNAPSGDPFNGTLDQLRVWQRARTADEVCAVAGGC